jgi:hypothetical protein
MSPDDDILKLISKIMHYFPKYSMDYIVSTVKKFFSTESYYCSCVILHQAINYYSVSFELVSRLSEEGIIDQLLKIFEMGDFLSTNLIFEFFSVICICLAELKREDVIKIVLNENLKYIRMNDRNIYTKSIYSLISTIVRLFDDNQNVDLSPIDFEELFELILQNEDSFFLYYSGILIETHQNLKQMDKNLIKRVVNRSIEILKSNQVSEMKNPYSSFETFVKFLKYDFRPWMVESIKICVVKLQDLLSEPEETDEIDEMEVFTILKTLIALFREDCEIYISKYKIVPMMIQFLNLEVDEVRIHVLIQF